MNSRPSEQAWVETLLPSPSLVSLSKYSALLMCMFFQINIRTVLSNFKNETILKIGLVLPLLNDCRIQGSDTIPVLPRQGTFCYDDHFFFVSLPL